MPVGLLCAIGTAACYGLGSVLQSAAAARSAPTPGLDPRLLITLARGWRYPAGLALDGVGFVLSLVALRSMPLYVVQSVTSSFLAVTAVVGAGVLGLALHRLEWAALGAVLVGLTLVALSAAPQHPGAPSDEGQWVLLGAALVLVVVSVPLSRRRGRAAAWGLGAAGGLGFGVVAVAARALSPLMRWGSLGRDAHLLIAAPSFYAVLVASPLGLITYATALQRGTVVLATAPLVVGETVLPAIAGRAFLGDRARTGWGVAAVLGFSLAVAACIALSRFGSVDEAPVHEVSQY